MSDTDTLADGTSPDGSLDPTAEAAATDPAATVLGAAEPAAWHQHALDMLAAGGPVVALLVVMSVVAVTITLVKLWQFRAARIGDRGPAREAVALFRSGRHQEAIRLLRQSDGVLPAVLLRAITGRLRGLPEAMVREEIVRFGGDQLEILRGQLRTLELIASLAPLLGLLGTVMGMIEAFQQLEAAGNQVNPSILSGGIWEALLTTAVGLAVAIPVTTIHAWLERSVDRLAHDLDSTVTQVFTEDLGNRPLNPAQEGPSHGHDRFPDRAPQHSTGPVRA